MSFTIKTAQNNKMSFIDANDFCEQVKFTTNIYQKLTFSGVNTHLTPTKLVWFTHYLIDVFGCPLTSRIFIHN